ncbi:hypothetical protein SCACP_06080 [Sporomusa carbonis]|uniref:hypothetical protein n=1 Tax=Sporomusa carbonis TaxID=3076075 RepID=UPI003A7687B0
MNKTKWTLVAIVVITVAGLYLFLNVNQAITGHVEFTGQGVDIVLDAPHEVEKLSIMNEKGKVLTVVAIGPGLRQKIPVFTKWDPDKKYFVELTLAGGKSIVLTGQSPAAGLEKVSFVLQAPYGLNSAGSIGVVPAGSAFTANILLTNHTDETVNIKVDIKIPAGLEAANIPQGMSIETVDGVRHIIGRKRLQAKNENWNEQLQLKAVQAGTKPLIRAIVTVDNGKEQWQMSGTAAVQVASVADISSKIRIQAVELPVDFTGRFDPKTGSGSLVYVPPSRLARLAGGEPDNRRLDDEPFAYAGIMVSNDGDEHVLILVSGKILDPVSGALAPAFTSPPHKNAGFGYSYGVAAIPPHSGTQVVLPVYLNENSAVAGSYLFKTEASVFGVNKVISSSEKEIQLVTRNDRPVMITLVMSLLAVIGTGWLLWRQEAALSRFSTKELVTVSLFGTVTFVTVNLPQTVLWDITHVVFGPFSFLFTGFFSQTVLYALMIALAVIIPRPGAITLMIIVRFILNGFIFGHFTPLQVLTYAALAVCLESALYTAGVTRNQAGCSTAGKVMLIAIACGLVDVVTSYMNFMAYMTLFRLFYADWYIQAVIAAGFVYTVAGAAIGCRLGGTLRRTSMD